MSPRPIVVSRDHSCDMLHTLLPVTANPTTAVPTETVKGTLTRGPRGPPLQQNVACGNNMHRAATFMMYLRPVAPELERAHRKPSCSHTQTKNNPPTCMSTQSLLQHQLLASLVRFTAPPLPPLPPGPRPPCCCCWRFFCSVRSSDAGSHHRAISPYNSAALLPPLPPPPALPGATDSRPLLGSLTNSALTPSAVTVIPFVLPTPLQTRCCCCCSTSDRL